MLLFADQGFFLLINYESGFRKTFMIHLFSHPFSSVPG